MAAVAKYRADNSVLYAEPDYVVRVDTTTPTDPLWPQQWDMAKIAAPPNEAANQITLDRDVVSLGSFSATDPISRHTRLRRCG